MHTFIATKQLVVASLVGVGVGLYLLYVKLWRQPAANEQQQEDTQGISLINGIEL